MNLTSVTPHVYFETAGFVVRLVTARVRACEVACFFEVGTIV